MVEIAHERRSRGPVGHLLRRATHIDIDDVGALRLGNACAFRHPPGLASGELHDMDADAGAVAANGCLAFSRARPAHAVISETTSPAPSLSASRRNGVSVMPDMGAKTTRFGTATGPIASDPRK